MGIEVAASCKAGKRVHYQWLQEGYSVGLEPELVPCKHQGHVYSPPGLKGYVLLNEPCTKGRRVSLLRDGVLYKEKAWSGGRKLVEFAPPASGWPGGTYKAVIRREVHSGWAFKEGHYSPHAHIKRYRAKVICAAASVGLGTVR